MELTPKLVCTQLALKAAASWHNLKAYKTKHPIISSKNLEIQKRHLIFLNIKEPFQPSSKKKKQKTKWMNKLVKLHETSEVNPQSGLILQTAGVHQCAEWFRVGSKPDCGSLSDFWRIPTKIPTERPQKRRKSGRLLSVTTLLRVQSLSFASSQTEFEEVRKYR